jgi:hypothetical protein
MGEASEDFDPSPIDKGDVRTIQMNRFFVSEILSTLAIEEGCPLFRDLALQLDEHVGSAFLDFGDFQHGRPLSSRMSLTLRYSATGVPRKVAPSKAVRNWLIDRLLMTAERQKRGGWQG